MSKRPDELDAPKWTIQQGGERYTVIERSAYDAMAAVILAVGERLEWGKRENNRALCYSDCSVWSPEPIEGTYILLAKCDCGGVGIVIAYRKFEEGK